MRIFPLDRFQEGCFVHFILFLVFWDASLEALSGAAGLAPRGPGLRGLDLSRRDCRRAADEKPDNIDQRSSDRQHKEQQRPREGKAKEGIQRIASWADNSDAYSHSQEGQRKLQAAFTVPEAVFPVALENRHQHRPEDTGCPQGRQEPKRERYTAAKFPQNHQPCPQPHGFEPLFLEPLRQLSETRALEPA